jgi:putative sterol carrier protein
LGKVADGWKKAVEIANSMPKAQELLKSWGNKAVQFVVEGEDPREFYVEAKDGVASFHVGKHPSPAFTMIGNADIMWKLLTREEDAVKAFMAKKYQVQGSLGESIKFRKILEEVGKNVSLV